MSLDSLVEATVEMFKPYAKLMPSMDPKYFHRPPIKFLALTVAALNKKTGFAKDLFTADQMKGVLPERDDKLNFFNDLKRYTEVLVNHRIDVDPRAIAAGKEVEKTLVLMQEMVKGAERPDPPHEKALARCRGSSSPKKEEKKEAKKEEPKKEESKKKEEPKKEERSPKKEEKSPKKEESPKKDDDAKKEEAKKEEQRKREEAKKEEQRKREEQKKKEEARKREEAKKEEARKREEAKKEEERKREEEKNRRAESPKPKKEEDEVIDEADMDVGSAKQARKAPPKTREEANVVVDAMIPEVIKEAEADDDVDDVFVEEDGRGASVEADGDKGKLVKDILDACRQMGPDKGQAGDILGDADRFKQGIELAKGLLQHLARSAQPLDTLIQFSQEDLGNMENEFKRWTEECTRQAKELEKERRATEQQNLELSNKIDELDKDIARKESKLRSIKAAAFLKEADFMKQFAGICS